MVLQRLVGNSGTEYEEKRIRIITHNHPLETLEEDEINAIHLGHLYVVRGPQRCNR